jgi:hypothetical protein
MAIHVLRRGDRVQNPKAFSGTAFTVLASNREDGVIKVISVDGKKRGAFSAPYHWRVESFVDPGTLYEFVLPDEDIKEEAETEVLPPPPPAEVKFTLGESVLIHDTVKVVDLDRQDPKGMYRCLFSDGSFRWMPASSLKPLPTEMAEPTSAENQAYELGIEEGRKQAIEALFRLIQREMRLELGSL